MKWISKNPPEWVCISDEWYNEKNKNTYIPDVTKRQWVQCNSPKDHNESLIPFSKKTKIMNVDKEEDETSTDTIST